jgi:hypothetical protein
VWSALKCIAVQNNAVQCSATRCHCSNAVQKTAVSLLHPPTCAMLQHCVSSVSKASAVCAPAAFDRALVDCWLVVEVRVRVGVRVSKQISITVRSGKSRGRSHI